jgi:hypothetical protein
VTQEGPFERKGGDAEDGHYFYKCHGNIDVESFWWGRHFKFLCSMLWIGCENPRVPFEPPLVPRGLIREIG